MKSMRVRAALVAVLGVLSLAPAGFAAPTGAEEVPGASATAAPSADEASALLRGIAEDAEAIIKEAKAAEADANARAAAHNPAKPAKDLDKDDEALLKKEAQTEAQFAKQAQQAAEKARTAAKEGKAGEAKEFLDQARALLARATVRQQIKALVPGETDKELDEKVLELVGLWRASGKVPPDDAFRRMAGRNAANHGVNDDDKIKRLTQLLKDLFENAK